MSNGPTWSASTTPRPPPSIIAGPPMPMLASGVAMIRSEQPRSAALPAKHRPDAIPIRGHNAGEPSPEGEGHHVETGDHRVIGVARPPAATLGKQHDRQAEPLDHVEEAVLLPVPHDALGPGEDGVVVGEHRTVRAVLADQRAVHSRSAGDEPVGRRAADRGRRHCGARAAPRSPARRTRRRSPGHTGRRDSRVRSGVRTRAGQRRHRRGSRRESGRGGEVFLRGRDACSAAPVRASDELRGAGRVPAVHQPDSPVDPLRCEGRSARLRNVKR